MDTEILGTFTISNNEKVNGTLKKVGELIQLACTSKDDFNFNGSIDVIYGVDHKLNTLSLLDCFGDVTPAIRRNAKFYTSKIFGHVLLSASKRISKHDKFSVAYIELKNPKKLLIDADNFIEDIVKESLQKENNILDFINQKEIFSSNTDLGKISLLCNSFAERTGNELNINLQSKLVIEFRFSESLLISDILNRVKETCLFFRFISGNEIYFENITLKEHEQSYENVEVLSNNYAINENYNPLDLTCPLVDVKCSKFPGLLEKWFENSERSKARYNFYYYFFQEQYHEARTMSSASIFDILYGKKCKKKLENDIEKKVDDVKEHVKTTFEKTEPIRQDLLNLISLAKTISLKDRIEKRIHIISSQGKEVVEICNKIKIVLPYAISARNIFVHGTPNNKISTEDGYKHQNLFTDVLEFVYITSELVEAGWDMTQYHPDSRLHRIKHLQFNLIHSIDEFLTIVKR